jgi:hypothetical protein
MRMTDVEVELRALRVILGAVTRVTGPSLFSIVNKLNDMRAELAETYKFAAQHSPQTDAINLTGARLAEKGGNISAAAAAENVSAAAAVALPQIASLEVLDSGQTA